MVPTTSSCPPADRLRQLLGGALPEADQAELVAHLDSCTACQQALERLAGANPALLSAARAVQHTVYDEEAPLRHVLSDLGGNENLTVLYPSSNRASWVQSLLRPAKSLEALGQLDDYEVTELLGQGGMGLVLKGFDAKLKRWVAIKVLAPDLGDDPRARQRFAREAQAAAAVRHPHVVTIHAVSEVNGLPFLVMEYVAGGSLQDYLDTHGPPGWRAVARLGAEIAAGLAAAHARGLVHRDIKPSNILLQTDGAPTALGAAKIADFGLARAADEARLTQTGIVAGTPMYMAPEQAQCEALDGRTDLFSLGSVLYTLSTGHEPFPAGSPVAVLRQVCETMPRPVRELNPAMPPWLAATIERLQAKRPADRFATSAEVAELLHYNLEHPDAPRPVPPVPSRAKGERGQRRRRRVLVMGILVAGLLAAGLALSESLRWTHLTDQGPAAEGEERTLPLQATLRGHMGPVWSLAFAPDGKTLATGSDDSSVRLWDPATGKQKAALSGHNSAVLATAFAHSGKFLISGDSDGSLRMWDVGTRKEQPPLPHHGSNVRRLSISPDDRTVAVGGSGQGIELWDVDSRTLRQTLAGHHGTVLAVAFAPDGQTLATGGTSGYLRLWDPDSGTERASFKGDSLGVRALAFTPDSRTLAAAGTGDKDVKLWDLTTQQATATFAGYENGVQNVVLSPDGRLLATGSRDGSVKLWDVAAAQVVAAVQAHQGSVWAVAFSPDGRTLATAGEDRLGKLWDLSGLTNPAD